MFIYPLGKPVPLSYINAKAHHFCLVLAITMAILHITNNFFIMSQGNVDNNNTKQEMPEISPFRLITIGNVLVGIAAIIVGCAMTAEQIAIITELHG